MVTVFRDALGAAAAGSALVSGDGQTEVEVVGTTSRCGTTAVRVDDLWHIGSCGKAMTASLYARLVEKGEAEWQVPVRALFPDVQADIDQGWHGPTIDDVLLCRSGMRANLSPLGMRRAWHDKRPPSEQRTAAVITGLSRPPRNAGRFVYSNLGYVVVGAAIDRLARMPYEDAMRVHVFEPLGITTAGVGPPPVIRGHHPRFRVGGLVVGRGGPADPLDPRSDNPAVLTPAGRWHLTLSDWARFLRVFLAEGTPLLQRGSVERLLAFPADGRGMAMGWAPAPRLAGVRFGMQGSNTMWSATAMVDETMTSAAMVVVNDGRSRVLSHSARLAAELLG